MSEAQCFFEEVLGIMLENGVQGKLAQPAMFLTLVMTEVHKVLNVVVGSDILDVLRERTKDRR